MRPSRFSSDRALAQAARAGDERAFAQLYARHHGRVRNEARRLTRSSADADDATAHAFASTFVLLQAGGGPVGHVRAYLVVAVRNEVRAQARRRATRVETTAAPDDIAVDDRAELRPPDQHPLAAVYAELPSRWQRVLWATEVEGYTPRELARELDLTPNAVAALSLRARAGLRDAYLHAVAGDDPHAWASAQLDASPSGMEAHERMLLAAHVENCPICAQRLAGRAPATGSLAAILLLAGAHPATPGHAATAVGGVIAMIRDLLSSPGGIAVTGATTVASSLAVLTVADAPRSPSLSGAGRPAPIAAAGAPAPSAATAAAAPSERATHSTTTTPSSRRDQRPVSAAADDLAPADDPATMTTATTTPDTTTTVVAAAVSAPAVTAPAPEASTTTSTSTVTTTTTAPAVINADVVIAPPALPPTSTSVPPAVVDITAGASGVHIVVTLPPHVDDRRQQGDDDTQ